MASAWTARRRALAIAAEDETEAPLLPYRMGEEVYLPLLEILHAAEST